MPYNRKRNRCDGYLSGKLHPERIRRPNHSPSTDDYIEWAKQCTEEELGASAKSGAKSILEPHRRLLDIAKNDKEKHVVKSVKMASMEKSSSY